VTVPKATIADFTIRVAGASAISGGRRVAEKRNAHREDFGGAESSFGQRVYAEMSTSNAADGDKLTLIGRYVPGLHWRWSEDTGLIVVFVLMLLAIGIPYPEFFSFGSITTILRQSALVGIIAFGMVYLVAMVEIDLSVGGVFAVAGSLSASLMKFYHVDPWIAVGTGLAAGAGLGAVNGILTSLLRVPLIIVSLGTLSGYLGLHLIISGGKSIYGLPRDHLFFRVFGGDFLAIPASVWTALACAIVLYFVFAHTRFGATVRAIGSNPAAAEFIGVRIDRIRIYASALVGFLAALSGVMALAYFKSVDTSSGRDLALRVIAAVVIGGTSLAGGSGTIIGAALGVLIITTIDSGLVFYGVNLNYSEFVTGIVIIGAIALDRILKRRRA
jgi:ribose transport system permease protein